MDSAWCFGAAVIAVHVAVPRPLSPFGLSPDAARHAEDAGRFFGEEALERARAIADGQVPFSAELHFGDPAEVIGSRAERLDVRMIVVGNRGLGRVDTLLLGSVSSAVMRRARCSVLVVRAEQMPV